MINVHSIDHVQTYNKKGPNTAKNNSIIGTGLPYRSLNIAVLIYTYQSVLPFHHNLFR